MIEDRLNWVAGLAARYAMGHMEGDKAEGKAICQYARDFTALEMAYFCQQVVSYFEDASRASMCLTIFTNRLKGDR